MPRLDPPLRRLSGRVRLGGSLRLRLTAIFAGSMAIVVLLIGALVYHSMSAELLAAVDRDLGARADALTATLRVDPSTPLRSGHRFVDPDEAFAQILDPSGRIVDATAGVAGSPLLTPAQLRGIKEPRFLTRPPTASDDAQRILAVPAVVDGQARIVVVGLTLGDRHDALVHLLDVLTIAGLSSLAVTCVGGWMLAGAALRPVEQMRRRAAELAVRDTGATLPIPGTDNELTRLGVTLNSLLERQYAAAERERRFVDDASHELRTPLAVLKAELDVTLARPRRADEQLDALRAASRETNHLVSLTEDLLVLARSRQGGLPLRRTPTPL